MIKAIEFFRRRADLAPEAFIGHWQGHHTNVVLGVGGLRRYVQNPVVGLAGLATASVDGVVEVWFDDLQTMRDNARSDYWAVVVEDEKRFIDRGSRQLILAESVDLRPIIAGPKLMLLVSKRPEAGVSEFQSKVMASLEGLSGYAGVRELTCDFPIPSSYEKPRALAGDAVLSLRFDAWQDVEQAILASVQTDLRHLAAQTTALAVAERVIKQ
jgi:uncharacterized protein (TIGR02118 family)